MTIFLTVLHVMVCFVLVIVVLLQRGKGAEIGAVFGGGASSTVFGSRGAGNFLTKLTTGSAVVFMVTSLLLAYYARERAGGSIFEEAPPAAEAPLAPEAGEAAAGEGEAASGFGEVGEPVRPEGAADFEEVGEPLAPEAAAPEPAPAENPPGTP